MYGVLEGYKPKRELYIEKRGKFLINAKNFYDGREMIIDVFKNKIFPKAPTALEDDEEPPKDEDKEEKKDDRLPTIEEEEEPMELKEQIAELDKRDLIYN